ncbi:MAG: tyrosine-type recombinase/integrase [Anaerolineales bacterium]|nr:tyrosine-type recombinase/integrase [Anaerolineales bacterium]
MSQRPLPAYAEKFLTTIDAAPKTVITYRHALQTFAEFLLDDQSKLSGADSSIVPLRLLQEDSPARFRHWMRSEREFSRRTENTYLAGVIRFIEWLDVHSLLPSGLMAIRMKLILREARGRRRTGYKTQPIKEAVPQIIAYYDNSPLPAPETPRLRRRRLALLRNRALVHTLFASGMRAHELAGLRRSDCADGRADRILITGKGEKERVVLLNPEAQAAIRAYLKARDEDRAANPKRPVPDKQEPLFIRHDRDQITPISTKTVWLVVSQAARALGLDTSISPHDFRRYIATAMLSEGMPLESVQEFLGHESIVTTRTVYARTRNEVLEDQVKTYRPTPAQALKRSLRYQKER